MKNAAADPTPARNSSSRRRFLARLFTAALTLLLGSGRAALAAARQVTREAGLTESDRLIASVAGPYAARYPADARRIAAWAESQLPPTRRRRDAGASAALVREHLLRPTRIAEELERDEVTILDGWVLARSEAAAAIYLHALTSEQGRLA
jgi:hypothetical protein